MTDLRIGAVGLGLRRSIAAAAHRPGHGSVIAAVADLDPDVRRREAEHFDTDIAVEDHHQLLKRDDLDAHHRGDPGRHATRPSPAMCSARESRSSSRSRSVSRSSSCDTILRTAYETGTRLYVGHNMRHMGVVRLMRDIIARGDIGEVKAVWVRHFVGYGGDYYFKDWHADRSRTTGLLLQKAAHDIDVLHWLADGYTSRVNALGDLLVYGDLPRREPDTPRPEGWLREFDWPPTARRDLHHIVDVEDVSVMNMQLDNGVVAAYQQCHFTPDYWRNYTVIGTEGRLENFGDGPGDVVKVWNTGPSGYRAQARHRRTWCRTPRVRTAAVTAGSWTSSCASPGTAVSPTPLPSPPG